MQVRLITYVLLSKIPKYCYGRVKRVRVNLKSQQTEASQFQLERGDRHYESPFRIALEVHQFWKPRHNLVLQHIVLDTDLDSARAF